MGKPRRKKQGKQARPANLLNTVKSYFTPDLVHRASSMVGEPEAAARRTLDESAAAVLRGLSRMVSSRDGADALGDLLRDSRYPAFAGNVAGLFSGGDASANAMISGHELLQTIFGSSISSVMDHVATSGGVAASSATKLLALVAPLTLGVLSKRAAAQELDISEIENLLRDAVSGSAATFPSGSPAAARATGPVLVPKPEHIPIAPEQETSDQISLTSSGTEPSPTELPAPSHKLRSILFLLAGLIVLALLILLLIRGPAHRDSLPRKAGTIEALFNPNHAPTAVET
jgi:hypothetical protein